jgi:tetratricopeptide (TPR) repeat protein
MEPTTINCPCGYGINLGSENKTCPICGLNLEPLHRINSLPYRYFEKGLSFYELKEFERAKQYFMTCLSLTEDPGPDLFEYLGLSSLGAEDYVSAGKYLMLAVEKNPDNKETANALTELKKKENKKKLLHGIMISLLVILPVCCLVFIILDGRGRQEIKKLEKIVAVQNEIITSKSAVTTNTGQTTVAKPALSLLYHVRPGETLSQISHSIYGTEKNWELIFNANKDKITNPDILEVQSSIIVPLSPENLQH